MQFDPIKPTLKAPGTMRLKLICDDPLANFALKFNLRRYAAAAADAATAYGKAAMHLAMCGGGSGGAVVGPLPDIALTLNRVKP